MPLRHCFTWSGWEDEQGPEGLQQAGKKLDRHRSWGLRKWQEIKGQTTEVG